MSTFGAERVSVAPQTAGAVTLGLLQGFRLERDGESLELPLGIQRLVAFLAVHNRPLLRLYVAGNLWIDSSEEHANANLRTALWRLHRLGFALVDATRSHLSLAPGVVVDLHDLSRRARQVLRDEAAPTRDNVDAILGGGDLLPDWYDDWVLVEREQFRQLRLLALETLCRELADQGSYATAVEAGLAGIAAEPLRESAHRALIGAHLAEGNRVEAIRQFRLYESLVLDELGVEPSAAIKSMLESPSGDGRMTTGR
ncbi:MAG TPA: BTAD domain-containing putative transcriptional regulator [Gaiellaceae bacterium]